MSKGPARKGTSHVLTLVGVVAAALIVIALIIKAIQLVVGIVLLLIALACVVMGVRRLRGAGGEGDDAP